jgi:hypothetical protein
MMSQELIIWLYDDVTGIGYFLDDDVTRIDYMA